MVVVGAGKEWEWELFWVCVHVYMCVPVSMHLYMHVHMCVSAPTCVWRCVHLDVYSRMYRCPCVCACVSLYLCTCMCMQVCTPECVRAHVHTCACMCMCILLPFPVLSDEKRVGCSGPSGNWWGIGCMRLGPLNICHKGSLPFLLETQRYIRDPKLVWKASGSNNQRLSPNLLVSFSLTNL